MRISGVLVAIWTMAFLGLGIVEVNVNEAAGAPPGRGWSGGGWSGGGFSSRSVSPGRTWGSSRQQSGRGQGYRPSSGHSSSSSSQWNSILRGTLQGLQNLQQSSGSRNSGHRPRYPSQPSYQPRYYQQLRYSSVPQNTYQPQQSTSSTPPKNTLPTTTTQRSAGSAQDQPANGKAFGAYLTGAQQQAAEEAAEEADQLADAAKDQLVNDPKLTDFNQGGQINGARDVRDALEKYEDTGDPSDLEKIRDDPNTPKSVREKVDLVIASTELGDQIRDGGLNTAGTDRRIERLRDRIDNSTDFTPAEKRELNRGVDGLEASNERRKIVDRLAEGGLGGGGVGGGFTSIDPGMIPADGPLFIEDPVADSEAAAVTSGVVLRNPDSNGAAIGYLLGGRQFTMEPGQSQRLGTSYVIEFDRGGSFGTARYTIADGTFEFTLTDRGWDLRKKTYEATIDNGRFPAAFGYLLDGQPYRLRAGEVRRHKSAYPMLVEFDRGDGSEPARKQIFQGTYTVGVDLKQGRLDLFEDSETLPSPQFTGN